MFKHIRENKGEFIAVLIIMVVGIPGSIYLDKLKVQHYASEIEKPSSAAVCHKCTCPCDSCTAKCGCLTPTTGERCCNGHEGDTLD